MLVLLHEWSPEADNVLGAFGVVVARVRYAGEKSACCNYLLLGFCNFGAFCLTIRNSCGVWAKNSARDIAGKEACARAALILSAILR
jgi:hypothetical protein